MERFVPNFAKNVNSLEISLLYNFVFNFAPLASGQVYNLGFNPLDITYANGIGQPTSGPPLPIVIPPPTQPSSPTSSGNDCQYMADVTVPDGSSFSTNQAFFKTWKVRNSGTKSWGNG